MTGPEGLVEQQLDAPYEAAAFIQSVMRWFGLPEGCWAFQALHSDRRCYGLSDRQLAELYRTADLIINLHGGTEPRAELYATDRLVYLETDPVQLQAELHQGVQATLDFLAPHLCRRPSCPAETRASVERTSARV